MMYKSRGAVLMLSALGAIRATAAVNRFELKNPTLEYDTYLYPQSGKKKAQWKQERARIGRGKRGG